MPTGPTRDRSIFGDSLPLLLGGVALAVALSRAHFSASPHVRPIPLAASVLVPLACAAAGGLFRGARMIRLALALTVGAMGVSGAVELPASVDIDSFGRTPLGTWIFLVPASLVLLLDPTRDRVSHWRPALLLLAAASAFGGALFVRAGDERFFLLAVLALQALWAARSAPRPPDPQLPFGLALGGGLFLLASLASFGAVDVHRHVQGLFRLVVALVPVALAWRLRTAPGWQETAIRGLLGGVLVGGLVGLVSIAEAADRIGLSLALGARLSLLGLHPNIAAPGLAVVVPLAAWWILARRGPDRALGLATLALASFEFALTRSRGATAALAAGLGLAVFCLICRRFAPRTRAVLFAVGLLLVGAGTAFGVREIQKRRADASSIGESLRFRLYIWETALEAIRERPALGYGLLTADPLIAHAKPSDFDGRSKDTHPHDVPLFWALGAGIGAAILYTVGVLALLALLAARTLGAEAHAARFHAALLASGAILFLAQLVDQGLALETPFPLHLGWLFALADPRLRRPALRLAPTTLAAAGLSLGVTAALPALAADRVVRAAQDLARRGERARAARLAVRSFSLWPFDLDNALRCARVLLAAQAHDQARVLLEECARRHPMSARPWDELAALLWQQRNFEGSWRALGWARSLDPTGPLHASRSMDAARLLLAMGHHEEALKEMARALRADPTILERIPWLEGEGGEKYIYYEGIEEPVFLSKILERNHRHLYEIARTDFIEARRTAAALARGYIFLGRLDLARRVIADFERLTGRTWLALEYMRKEIAAAEARLGRKSEREDPAPSGDDVADAEEPSPSPEPAGGEPIRGSAGVWMGEAKARLVAGDARGAIDAVHRALEQVYDVSAEREYVALLFDILVLAHRQLGELDEARRALRGALYLRPRAEHAVERIVTVAEDFAKAGRHRDAVDLLAEASRLVRYVPSGPAGKRPLVRFADALAPYLSQDPPAADDAEKAEIRQTVARILLSLHDHPIGELLVIRRLREQGRLQEAKRRLDRFRREHPEWSER